MLKLTLSTYTLELLSGESRKVWQVMCCGSPLTRELDDRETAAQAAQAAIARHHGRVQLMSWDGDAGVESLLFEGVGGSGSERNV